MSVVFDNNIWISYAIGKQLNDIPILLKHPDLELFACNELLDEFERVRQYPKLQKFLTPERAAETFELMLAKAVMVQITARTANFTDAKDNYLLDRCNVAQVDFLVTGDKLLLALETFNKTRILSYRAFCAILGV